jgi:hypothetical protein
VTPTWHSATTPTHPNVCPGGVITRSDDDYLRLNRIAECQTRSRVASSGYGEHDSGQSRLTAYKAFAAVEAIGCFSGPSDLSMNPSSVITTEDGSLSDKVMADVDKEAA